jgi:hypothetical protein
MPYEDGLVAPVENLGNQAKIVARDIEHRVHLISYRNAISMRIGLPDFFQTLPFGRLCRPVPTIEQGRQSLSSILPIGLQQLLPADDVQIGLKMSTLLASQIAKSLSSVWGTHWGEADLGGEVF